MPITEKAKTMARLLAIKWNTENPIDYAWRREFGVAFGSEEHKAVDFIDQQIWYEENEVFEALRKDPNVKFNEEGRVIISSSGTNEGMTQKEIEDAFDALDIKQLNKMYGGERKSDD